MYKTLITFLFISFGLNAQERLPSNFFDAKKNINPIQKEEGTRAELDQKAESDRLFGTAHKVKWIGAILNQLDEKNYFEALDSMAVIAERYDFDVGGIYILGRYRQEQTDAMVKLSLRGGQFKFSKELPERYQVNRYPVWLVTTEEGEYVFDGTGNLGRLFNGKGELLIPESPESESIAKDF